MFVRVVNKFGTWRIDEYAVMGSLSQLPFALLNVRVLEVVGEEDEEPDRVASDEVSQLVGIVAVDEEQLKSVHHDEQELNHLDGGEVLLPPQILLVLGAEGREEVIPVHDDVDECVDHAEERRVSAREKLQAPPD